MMCGRRFKPAPGLFAAQCTRLEVSTRLHRSKYLQRAKKVARPSSGQAPTGASTRRPGRLFSTRAREQGLGLLAPAVRRRCVVPPLPLSRPNAAGPARLLHPARAQRVPVGYGKEAPSLPTAGPLGGSRPDRKLDLNIVAVASAHQAGKERAWGLVLLGLKQRNIRPQPNARRKAPAWNAAPRAWASVGPGNVGFSGMP